MKAIRVLLADDQTLLRDGLHSLLESEDDIVVAGEAGNGREAVEKVHELMPDVVLMDIRMPEMDGVEATRRIKKESPGTAVIMLTTFDDDEYIIKAMTYGAAGYLLKDMGSEKLIAAIRDGVAGNIILPGRIAAKITMRLSGTPEPPSVRRDMFSERELSIIALMLDGRTNGEIADTLYLTVGTVKNYISQIYMKLDVKDRTNAVLALRKMG